MILTGKNRRTQVLCIVEYLLGEFMNAQDAEKAGLVSKVFPVEELVNKHH